MRAREAVREGWRDVVVGAAGAAVFAVVFAVVLGAVVGLRVAAVAGTVRGAHEFVAAGAATTVVQADGRIDGRACDALVALPSVQAAGALRVVGDGTVPSALPRTALPTYDITPGFPALLALDTAGHGPRSDGPGVLASVDVADELGLRAGATLATASGDTSLTSVYAFPDDGRDPDLAYALLSPGLDDGRPFDACWATIWPEDDSAVAAARRTVLPASGAEGEERVTTGQLNPRLGTTFVPGAAALDFRATAALALSLGVAVGWVALVRRRLAVASDRHVGVAIGAQILGMVAQHLTWALVGAVAVGATAVLLVRGFSAPDAVPVLVEAVGSIGLGVVGAVLGGALGLLTIRERSMHRYFRTR